jgi:cell division protein FtsI/penicillin-binding protein 2
VLLGVIVSARLFEIQVWDHAIYSDLASKQYRALQIVKGSRGIISDRDRTPLALNRPCYDIGVHRAQVEDIASTGNTLSKVLGMRSDRIQNEILGSSGFVLLRRQVEPERALVIKSMALPGVTVDESSERSYPFGEKLAPVLGYVDVDGKGISGLELEYNDFLLCPDGQNIIQRDAKGRTLWATLHAGQAKSGHHIILTIDDIIQTIVEEELASAVAKNHAKGGTVVVTNPQTGEILAMASAPGFNANNVNGHPEETHKIRSITDIYEPGSTFKIVTLAALLADSTKKLDDIVFCENGAYKLYGETIHDTKKHAWLSLENVFVLSSNIGTSKIARDLGPDAVYLVARNFGFGNQTGIGLPGEVNGILKNPRHWSKFSTAAISFGHEVAVTPLQIAMAYGAIANGGQLMKPVIVKEIQNSEMRSARQFRPQVIRQVLDGKTAKTMAGILEKVVQKGTGTEARLADLPIAGKTGTAQKLQDGQYSKSSYVASFVGFYPTDRARILIHVTLDEPRPEYYGGKVAAPVFKQILSRVLDFKSSPISNFGTIRYASESEPESKQLRAEIQEQALLAQLVGKRKHDAIKLMEDWDLPWEVIGAGAIVEEVKLKRPRADSAPKALVTLTDFALDSEQVSVPDLTRMSLRKAVSELSKRGLKVKIYGSGEIKRQDPPAGTKLKVGSTCLIECESPKMNAAIDKRYGPTP